MGLDQRVVNKVPGNVQAPGGVQGPPGDLEKTAIDATKAAMVMKTMRDAGIVVPPAPDDHSSSKVQEKYGLDVGTIVKSQSDLIGNLLGQMTTMMTTTADSKTKAELGEMKGQMQELVKALQAPNDPLKALKESHDFLEALTEKYRAKAAPTAPGLEQAGLAALPIYMKMEEMKLEAEERRLTHEREMAELRRHWVKEDRVLTQDFQLRQQQFDWEQRIASKKSDQLGSILGALAQGIDLQAFMKGGGVGQLAGREPTMAKPPEGAQAATPPQVGQMPQAFQCSTCGQKVVVPSPDAESIQCPTCGQFYDAAQFAEPEAPSPPPTQGPGGMQAVPGGAISRVASEAP